MSLEAGWLEYGDVPVWGDDHDHVAWEINNDVFEGKQVEKFLNEKASIALGLELNDLHEDLPVMMAGEMLICAVPNTMYLDGVDPDLERVKILCLEVGVRGLLVFTFPGRGGCFTDSRCFVLQGDHVLEEAASPDAHAALAAYLCANQFFDDGPRSFTGAQGYRLGQRSKLEVRLSALGGSARDVQVREVNG